MPGHGLTSNGQQSSALWGSGHMDTCLTCHPCSVWNIPTNHSCYSAQPFLELDPAAWLIDNCRPTLTCCATLLSLSLNDNSCMISSWTRACFTLRVFQQPTSLQGQQDVSVSRPSASFVERRPRSPGWATRLSWFLAITIPNNLAHPNIRHTSHSMHTWTMTIMLN